MARVIFLARHIYYCPALPGYFFWPGPAQPGPAWPEQILFGPAWPGPVRAIFFLPGPARPEIFLPRPLPARAARPAANYDINTC